MSILGENGIQDLKQMVAMMRDQGVSSFTIGNVHVEFGAEVSSKIEASETPEQQIARAKREADILLYGSADG